MTTREKLRYSDLVVGVEEMGAVDERGNLHRVKNWQVTEAGFQAMRDGFMCHECTEWPLPQAFPERCPTCGFEVAKYQTELLARDHQGEIDVSEPSPNMRAVMEEREREAFRKRAGIWVPGDPI